MTGVDEARNELIQLQIAHDEETERLAAANLALARAMQDQMLSEQMVQRQRHDLLTARKRLEREEQLAEAHQKSTDADEGVERLRERFLNIAADKIWFTGTGHEDAVLDFQLQAMMFGAVAKRWICGDEPGLGKTRTAVGWLDLVGSRKVIIIAEANICGQFAGEVYDLAPHREVVNLAKRTPAKRHELIDIIVSKSDCVVIVNYEMWRRDKDALAKLIGWQADTIIVDEAHNLKSTGTANFGYAKTLIAMDNLCPKCGGLLKGLWDAEALASSPSRKVPKPCEHCKWMYGQPTPKRYASKLDTALSTRSVKNVLFTTGTPILNDPVDLFSLLHLCDPELFKTKANFQTTFLTQNHMSGKWDFRDGAMANLKPLIDGLFIARKKEDAGIVLPPQHPTTIIVDLDKETYRKQYGVIRDLTDQAQIELDSGQHLTIMHLIALITRKRQANVWPGGIVVVDKDPDSVTFGDVIFDSGEVDESVKMDVIQENILKMHELGHRQVVFSQFKTGLAEFEKRLTAAGLRVARFDGDTKEKDRLEIKSNLNRRNNEESKWDVVLANYKTGGTGLNFTAATVTHILDEEWNPGKRDQAYHRTNRIGQTEETFVFVYRIRGTVDTWMANTIQRKQNIIDGFEGAMTEAVNEDLRDTFRAGLKSGEIL